MTHMGQRQTTAPFQAALHRQTRTNALFKPLGTDEFEKTITPVFKTDRQDKYKTGCPAQTHRTNTEK